LGAVREAAEDGRGGISNNNLFFAGPVSLNFE
jgi:hypothetical protein